MGAILLQRPPSTAASNHHRRVQTQSDGTGKIVLDVQAWGLDGTMRWRHAKIPIIFRAIHRRLGFSYPLPLSLLRYK